MSIISTNPIPSSFHILRKQFIQRHMARTREEVVRVRRRGGSRGKEEDSLKHITITPCYWPFKSSLYIVTVRFEHLESCYTRLRESIVFLPIHRTKFRSWSRGWSWSWRWSRREGWSSRRWRIPGWTMILFIYRPSWSWRYMIMTRWVFESIQ